MRIAAVRIALVMTLLAGTADAAAARDVATSDMPGGVLIGAVRGDAPGRQNIIFTNVDSLPLYYLDAGARCDGPCEETWAPFLAVSGDRPVGEWTLARRDGGQQQWAYHGNLVYTFLKDESHGEETNRQGSRRFGAAVAAGDGQDGRWHVVTVALGSKFKKPSSISLAEHAVAQGQILANTRRAPLYAFEGKKGEFEKLSADWQPAPAGLSEIPVGEFSIVERSDGIRQWAYRKQPLFSYKNDLLITDLKGVGVVKGMKPAVAIQYFMPAQVEIAPDATGGRFIETASGKSLYARDRINWTEIRNDVRGSPEIGQSIGIAGCDKACEAEWPPLLAPASARPGGHWNLISRPDGAKQWTYRGYALYTRANELPGVVHYNEVYDVAINHTTEELHPEFMGIGLYWRVATP